MVSRLPELHKFRVLVGLIVGIDSKINSRLVLEIFFVVQKLLYHAIRRIEVCPLEQIGPLYVPQKRCCVSGQFNAVLGWLTKHASKNNSKDK